MARVTPGGFGATDAYTSGGYDAADYCYSLTAERLELEAKKASLTPRG